MIDERPVDPWASDGWQSHIRAMAALPSPGWQRWLDPRTWAKKLMYGNSEIGSHLAPLSNYLASKHIALNSLSIVDIGGGFGDNYDMLFRSEASRYPKIDYTVVDNAESCAIGRSLFPECSFSTEIPDKHFDLAVIIGTLQYIGDWRKFIDDVKKATDIVYIARSPVRSAGTSFAAKQAVCPAYGDAALRKVGVADLNVISKDELKQSFHDWDCVIDRRLSDYSAQFSRFPTEMQNDAYCGQMWLRRT